MSRRELLLFLISTLSQFPLSTIRFIAPIYAVKLGAAPFVLGAMGASYGGVYILLATYFGRVSERVGYGRMTALGLLIYAFVVSWYPFVKDPYELIAIRGGEAVGMAMVWPAIEAYSQAVRESRLELSVMIYTLSWSVMASVAPYVGALLLPNFTLAIGVVVASSVAGAAVGALIARGGGSATRVVPGRISAIYDIILPVFIFGFNYSVITSFYPAYGESIGLGTLGTGLASAALGAGMVAAFLGSGLLISDGRPLVLMGIALQLSIAGVYLVRSLAAQAAFLFLTGFGEGLIYFNVLLEIVRKVSSGIGLRTGIFESSIGLGSIIGPLASGLPTALGLRLPWVLSFAVSCVAALLYAAWLARARLERR